MQLPSSNTFSQEKGDFAVLKTVLNLKQKGFLVFKEVVSEYLPYDLLAYKDKKYFKIQCKYSQEGKLHLCKLRINTKRTQRVAYTPEEVDYFAVYCPIHDVVLYPSINFKGTRIAYEERKATTPYYYWKDFVNFTDVFVKRTYKDFGTVIDLYANRKKAVRKPKKDWPSDEQLAKEVFETPLYLLKNKYDCSDVGLKKHCLKNGILLPKRGYFLDKQIRTVA